VIVSRLSISGGSSLSGSSIRSGEGGISPERDTNAPNAVEKPRLSPWLVLHGVYVWPVLRTGRGVGGMDQAIVGVLLSGWHEVSQLRTVDGWGCTMSGGLAELDSETPSWGRTEGP